MNNETHVVYVRSDLSDDYNCHCAASIASVLDNCSGRVVVHLIYDYDLSSSNTLKLEDEINKYNILCSNYDAELVLHEFTFPDWLNHMKYPTINDNIKIVFSRVFLSQIIQNGVDYVLCLGSDTIVKTDVQWFVNKFKSDKILSGVVDNAIGMDKRFRKHVSRLGVGVESYINADVLIVNVNKIRNEGLCLTFDDLSLFLDKYSTLHFYDQDLLNIIYRDDKNLIPSKYNILVNYRGQDEISSLINSNDTNYGYILHFAGNPKPWSEHLRNHCHEEYWYYLSKTPWCDNAKVLIDSILTTTTPEEVITRPDNYIWRYPLLKKMKLLFNLTFPLYLSLLGKYLSKFRIIR